jgi:flagellar basal body-associated protein FliL
LTTKTANSPMPEPDTAGDAAQPPDNKKMPFSEKNILNTTNVIVAIVCSTMATLFAIGGVFVRGVQTEQRSIETAAEVKEIKTTLQTLSVVPIKQAYMEQSAIEYRAENRKTMESIVAKLDKMADRK